jgi:30S ribosomal protein S31
MGKGDQRTRRGKIYRGTFGKRRPRKKKKLRKKTG